MSLSYAQRVETGFEVKRLLDMGRIHYLDSLGFDAELIYYTKRQKEIGSLENTMVLATKRETESRGGK